MTGSAGHLGEALVRVLRETGHSVVGLDLLDSAYTDVAASVTDRRRGAGGDGRRRRGAAHRDAAQAARGVPLPAGVRGHQRDRHPGPAGGGGRRRCRGVRPHQHDQRLRPGAPPGRTARRRRWITEDVVPRPRNIYGATKVAAEDLCELIAGDHGLPCVVLRTSRFFPEQDDDEQARTRYADANLKVNELLYRRDRPVRRRRRAPGRTGAGAGDRLRPVRRECDHAVRARRPGRAAPRRSGRRRAAVPATIPRSIRARVAMLPGIDRVYVNDRARADRAGNRAMTSATPSTCCGRA